MSDITLKPCPFCGAEVDYGYTLDMEPQGVWCVKCKMLCRFTRVQHDSRKSFGETMAEIAERWNRRDG